MDAPWPGPRLALGLNFEASASAGHKILGWPLAWPWLALGLALGWTSIFGVGKVGKRLGRPLHAWGTLLETGDHYTKSSDNRFYEIDITHHLRGTTDLALAM